jgi:hypothetical protein
MLWLLRLLKDEEGLALGMAYSSTTKEEKDADERDVAARP